MNRTLISGLIAAVVAVGALAAPAQAHYKSFGYGHHHVKKHHHFKHKRYHKFHAYRHVYKPVCVKYDWVYSYGYKKLKCVAWR